MNLFAQSAFENIQNKVKQQIEKNTPQKKLIITTSSFPPDIVFELIQLLETQLNERIILTLKIAKKLADEWKNSVNNVYKKLPNIKYIGESDNFTSLRNASAPEENKLGLIVLIGVDKITDSSSLSDFYRCDPNIIWHQQMQGSFKSWIKKRLDSAHIGYEDDNINHFNKVLLALMEQGCADLFQLSTLLQNLQFENLGIQDGKDALKLLLKSLRELNLPSLIGFKFRKSNQLSSYIEMAIRFFRYDIFLEERNKKNALNAIELLKDEKINEIKENCLFTTDERGKFETDEAFIDSVREYIENEDDQIRQKLFYSDFITILDKILKFKPKTKIAPSKETVRKLTGGPVEVILTALWNTFGEFCRINRSERPILKSITITGEHFRYDNEGLTEDNNGSYKELQERAKEYLRKLINGVDHFFNNGYLDVLSLGEGNVEIVSKFYNEDILCTSSRTAEPSYEYKVELGFLERDPFSRKFAWRLPQTQSYRIAEELVQWAANCLKEQNENPFILPVFQIPYHEELILAKDEDETKRVLLHSIRDVSAKCTNLLTEDWRKENDPLLYYLQKLALSYWNMIEKAKKDGLHAIFHKDSPNSLPTCEIFLDSFEDAVLAFRGKDEDCKNSPMGAMLMRAFLFVTPRNLDKKVWVAEPIEKSAIVTVLHPSILEMLNDHICYLFACFNYAVKLEWQELSSTRKFAQSQWQDYLDLAAIKMPLGGLISNENKVLDTQIRGQELIHRIGSTSKEEAPLSTRLLLRYDEIEEDEISDTDMFAENRDSRLLEDILNKYLKIHPHAWDGIRIAVYRNEDIQPVISAIHSYLCNLLENNSSFLDDRKQHPYVVDITLFSEVGEDVGVTRWIEQWKERWEAAETDKKYNIYKYCRFSIAHRVVPINDKNRRDFCRMIQDSLDVDIVVLYNFISASLKGNDFQTVKPYNILSRTLKFPIIEKPFCVVDNPTYRLRRARIISNPQFRIASLHLEAMAHLKYPSNSYEQENVLIGYGDYSSWQEIIDELHKHAEWVVCIDPTIDEKLIKQKKELTEKEREIIGFGSGVGLHGELNYTISTERFSLLDIQLRLHHAIKELYPSFQDSQLTEISKSVVGESQSLSGVSLVKATGVGDYLRDFMAYCLTNKLLKKEENILCSYLITLDAYQHWFSLEDKTRPDLLWLTATLNENGYFNIDMHIMECKLATEKTGYIEKAIDQIKNGLKTLIPVFLPRNEKNGDDTRPDQRYWWLQLHRLIASKTEIKTKNKEEIITAMERLADGEFNISWHAGIIAFWTNKENNQLKKIGLGKFVTEKYGFLEFGIYSLGQQGVYNLCQGDGQLKLIWEEIPLCFKFSSNFNNNVEIQPEEFVNYYEENDDVSKTSIVDDNASLNLELDSAAKASDITIEAKCRIPERILLGETTDGNREVYWEFGHKDLWNRHLLVFGTSGMGKTYAIQCLLCEMGLQAQNALVMDYTNGFLPKQLEEETKKILNPYQHIIRKEPLPINPFKLQVQEIDEDLKIPETSVSASKRIATTFSQVYETLGDQQYSVLFDAIKDLIEKFGNKALLEDLLEILEEYIDDNQHEKNVVLSIINKLKPFIVEKPFSNQAEGLDWRKIFNDNVNRCHVFQFAGMDSESARLIIEFVLWDLNAFVRGTGNKNLPKVIVLDEAQNLDLTEQSPVAKYLTEGRKFGLSLILATQTMKNLQGEKLNRLFQAAHKLFFRPADTKLQDHAKLLVSSVGGIQQEWVSKLASLTKGQCYSLGPSLNMANNQLETKAFKILITSLKERFKINK